LHSAGQPLRLPELIGRLTVGRHTDQGQPCPCPAAVRPRRCHRRPFHRVSSCSWRRRVVAGQPPRHVRRHRDRELLVAVVDAVSAQRHRHRAGRAARAAPAPRGKHRHRRLPPAAAHGRERRTLSLQGRRARRELENLGCVNERHEGSRACRLYRLRRANMVRSS
jgi:hypothetical protein